MSWGSLKPPGSRLSEPTPPPTARTKVPSLASLTMRLLPPRWPSAIQMSPSGAIATPGRAVEVRLVVAVHARLADPHHHVTLARELDDLVPHAH